VVLGEVSYHIARPCRAITSLVWPGVTKMRETAEIARAAAAMARCQREAHTAEEDEEG
jgi:hypothetical protein